MFLTIILPEGIPQELVMPHYFLQEIDAPIFFWMLRLLFVAAMLGSVIACIYFEKKTSKTEAMEENSGEREDL